MTSTATSTRRHVSVSALGDVIYHGKQPERGGNGLISIETGDGMTIGNVPHLPKHSPTGYAWGYLGSGAADAARSLLLTALGDESKCPFCIGGCDMCDGGFVQLPYQMFKFAVLGDAPHEFRMTRRWLLGWLARAQGNITVRTVIWSADGWPGEP